MSEPTPDVEVRRSRRRRRTVSAYVEDDRIVVLVPDNLTRAEERDWVRTMVARLQRRPRPGAVRGGPGRCEAATDRLRRRRLARRHPWVDRTGDGRRRDRRRP